MTVGIIALASGDLDQAEAAFTESYSHAKLIEESGLMRRASIYSGELAGMRGDVTRAAALLEEALAGTQASGTTWDSAIIMTLLGHLCRQQQHYALAKVRYREALALYRTFGSPAYVAMCLEGFAAAVCAEGHYVRATRLCAAAAALREEAQTPLPPAEQVAFEQVVATARAVLDEPTFTREWYRGTALAPDEAINDADRAERRQPSDRALTSSRVDVERC